MQSDLVNYAITAYVISYIHLIKRLTDCNPDNWKNLKMHTKSNKVKYMHSNIYWLMITTMIT